MDNIVRLTPNVTCTQRKTFRDRLAGRTPRSERGGRGSSPCPGSFCSTRGRVAQPGRERLSNKQDVAGSNPASPTPRGRSSVESGRLKRGASQVRVLPTTSLRLQCASPPFALRLRSSTQSRRLLSFMHAPVVDEEMTPGSQPGGSGFDSRRGYQRTTSACRGARPPRRFWEPETAGSTPARQTCAVGERLSSRAS
jgi:hypothetical protein